MKTIKLEDWQVKNLREYFGENDSTQTSHWAFPIFDKAHKKQSTIPIVMPELLCIDNKYATGITVGKKYKALFENETIYFLKDDDDEIWGFNKKHFAVVAQ